jgi:predicted AlkP superfamily pyrophosphatase or phosphodiesterase
MPVMPDYLGANIRGIVPALLAPPGVGWPVWLAGIGDAAATADEPTVLLVLDGLGWEQLVDHADCAPTLMSLPRRPITSVAPSTTASALTSITTGMTPGEHGIVGYRMAVGATVMNTLRWHDGSKDLRALHQPSQVQPHLPFLGEAVPVVTKAEFERTGFTAAHLRGGLPHGWRLASNIPVICADLLAGGAPLVYAYYDGIDKVAHERGFGRFYEQELRAADRLVADVLSAMPPGATLIVTADHGQVHVPGPPIELHPGILADVVGQSGEGRFRWLHTRPGTTDDVAARCRSEYGDRAWVWSRREAIDAGLFGAVVPAPHASRLGDVALVPFADVTFHDPADSGPFPLICRHGSLTSAEMRVPLVIARP